jgi:hypothetical protein
VDDPRALGLPSDRRGPRSPPDGGNDRGLLSLRASRFELRGRLGFEFRHGTITPTFLATPTRWPVLVAKSVATAAVGALLGVAAVAGVLAVAVPWLGAIGESLSLGDAAPTLAKSVLIAALLAALGVAIGSLVHSQAGALAGGLIALLVAEPLVVALAGVVDLDGIDRYLPASAIFGVADPSADDPLPLAAGVLVGLGWITAVGVLGIFRTMGRDFT